MAWFLWPISFSSFVVLTFKSIKKKQLLDTLPLLLALLNFALIWSFLASYELGYFLNRILREQILDGYVFSFRNFILKIFLSTAVYLEPISLFLYTWRFFKTII